jgi:hypothetical protein
MEHGTQQQDITLGFHQGSAGGNEQFPEKLVGLVPGMGNEIELKNGFPCAFDVLGIRRTITYSYIIEGKQVRV